jgi:hypothetical protein
VVEPTRRDEFWKRSMTTEKGMTIDRSGDALIVRSPHRGINWLGVVFAAFAVFWVFSWNRHDAQTEDAYWLGLAGGIVFVFIGIALLLPRAFVTIFDLHARRVRRQASVFGWAYRDKSYPFSEIRGVAIVDGSLDDNRDSLPIVILKSGLVLPLNTIRTYRVDIGDRECISQVENICEATGLTNLGSRDIS